MTRPLLLTGFEPFGSHALNPSAAVARMLNGERVGDLAVCSEVLPVAHQEAPGALRRAIEEHDPAAVVSLGLAAGRAKIAVERVAINVLDFAIPDNEGARVVDVPIAPDGPDAYFSTLPFRAIHNAWKAEGVAGYISDSAGTFICNQVFYLARHWGTERFAAGFIHVPLTPDVAATAADSRVPSMTLDEIARGVLVALRVTEDALRGAVPAGA